MFDNVDATADCSNQLQPQPGKAMTIHQQGGDPPPLTKGGERQHNSQPHPPNSRGIWELRVAISWSIIEYNAKLFKQLRAIKNCNEKALF